MVKKIIGKIHLWLGLSSGLLVFVIAITGCIYAFQEEIKDLTQPYRFAETHGQPHLPPSQLQPIAEEALPGKHLHAVLYYQNGRSAQGIFYSFEENYYYIAYLNPATGEVLKVRDEYADFFRFILDGHFYLWLPPHIGQPVVASATLVFVVMLLSGLVLWWPRNKNGRKQRFSIKWNARWRRKNYDLHNVLGFYAMGLALVLALTGLVWGFQWFRDAVYSATSGGKTFVEYADPASDTSATNLKTGNPLDLIWLRMKSEYPNAEWIEVHPPETTSSSIAANANPDASTYWKTDYRYFDQYTLEELSVDHVWGRFEQATLADKVMRINYDVHVGAIGGLAGKILAFLISLMVASLPITGFLIWWGRKYKTTEANPEKPTDQRKPLMKARPAEVPEYS